MVEKRGTGGSILLLLLALGALAFGAYLVDYALDRNTLDERALHLGVPILGAGLLLLAAFLGRTVGRRVAIVAFVVLAAAAAWYIYRRAHSDDVVELEAANREYKLFRLWRVCHGWTYPEATPYGPGPGLHPTAIIATTDEGEWLPWRNRHPPGWEPSSLEQAELVACLTTEGRSGYGQPDLTTVRLVAVANGSLVAETTLEHELGGSEPVLAWLRPLVEGSGP
jgi:hypothetical protein